MSAIVGLKIKPFFGKFAIVAIRANGTEERLGTKRDYDVAKVALAHRAELRGMTVNEAGTEAA